jgi:MFS family permease
MGPERTGPASSAVPDESSWRYPGWRTVAACFAMALFCWGFGLYGHGVYLAELQRIHGWPASLISAASTMTYLVSAMLGIFTSDAIARLGPKRFVLLGIAAMGTATALIAVVTEPWQLYAAYGLMAAGWMGLGITTISTILSLWFRERGGLAISLALNGASCGGIIVAPALVFLTAAIGFTAAMLATTAVMTLVLVPVVVFWIDRPPERTGAIAMAGSVSPPVAAPAVLRRPDVLRSFAFWTVSAPFALALLAQIGFLVHQISFLAPIVGRAQAGFAVVVTTAMAVVGRLTLGALVDRLDPRAATAGSLVSQAAALFALIWTRDPASLMIACAVYGFSVGNIITLPPLIIRREFAPASFAVVMGLSSAVGTFIGAFGPAIVGFARDVSGGYGAALALCVVLKLAAAAVVTLRRGGTMASKL